MDTTKLMAMYKGTFQPALAEGTYKVKLTKHEYVENEQDHNKDYVRVTFEVLEGNSKGRILTENRFVSGFPVMISHLRQQLKRENEEVVVQDFLNGLIEEATPFNIYVVKRVVNGVPKTNFNFLEPIKVTETKPNTEVVDDSAEEEVKEESAEKETK